MGYFKEALIGTGWMGALRGVTRGLGFIKIAILARILTPHDFGLFAIAGIALALLETFTQTGVSLALVQQREEIDEYVNTAWVISILRGFIIGLLLLLSAPLISSFFNEPKAMSLLITISLIPMVRGFINPAVVNFVKKLEFQKEFKLRGLSVIAEAVAAIIFVVLFRSAVAIVYGMLVGAILEVILSLTMTQHRPRIQLIKSQALKLISFGKWVTLGGIMGYLAEQFDDIIVGRLLGTISLGTYQMAFKLSVLTSGEIAETLSKVTFPVYSKIAGDQERLKRAVKKTTLVIAVIAIPAGLIFVLFPQMIIRLVLGSQWLGAAGALQILAIYGILRAISQAPSAALFASGRPDLAAKIRSFRFIIMAALLIPLVGRFGLQGAAMAVVASAAVTQVPLWLSIRKLLWVRK